MADKSQYIEKRNSTSARPIPDAVWLFGSALGFLVGSALGFLG